jgi:methyl-accepting chemotaxis protein
MNWFKRLKVGTRLTLGFLVVAAIGGVIGAEGIRGTAQINDLATLMYEQEIAGITDTSEANIQLLSARLSIRSAVLATTAEERDQHLKQLDDELKQANRELDSAENSFVTAEGQALVKDARAALQAYGTAAAATAIQLRTEPLMDSRASTQQLFHVLGPLAQRADDLLGQAVNRKKSDASRHNNETDRIYASVRTTLICFTIGGVLTGALLGILIARGLTRQLGGEPADLASAAVAISQGKLNTPIMTRHALPGSVVHAMAAMQEGLRQVVTSVRASSDSIATGAHQIASGNADLSQRTEEQASNLQQTAASMEQLSSTVQNNADAARQVTALASGASDVALQGGTIVGRVVSTMQEIHAASRRISDIIAVIEGIAFQTNILALNAAVEAARAGEQGRGFAVVASEVRTLAKRSADAAKEIRTLIGDSVGKVELGSRLVEEAGSTMDDIVNQVRRVTDLITEISAATHEQTAGIGQVSDAVLQLDQVTQQNAALVEEAAAAADSLDQQAKLLVQTVAAFQLETQQEAGLHAASLPHVSTP